MFDDQDTPQTPAPLPVRPRPPQPQAPESVRPTAKPMGAVPSNLPIGGTALTGGPPVTEVQASGTEGGISAEDIFSCEEATEPKIGRAVV